MSLRDCRTFIIAALVLIFASLSLAQTSYAANGSFTTITPGTNAASETRYDSSGSELAAGTRFATLYYVNESGVNGPTVMIIGGMHGNEPAGYLAARRFAKVRPRRGRLIVIPEANRLAVKAGARIGGHPGDLNRDFPRTRSENPDSTLAKSIWSLVMQTKPDYLLDLHEGYDFHKQNSRSVGQTIIYYPKGDTVKMAQAMQSSANARISDSRHEFSLMKYPVKGSLARSSSMFTRAKTMIIETSKRQPIDVRVDQHTNMINAALERLGMR